MTPVGVMVKVDQSHKQGRTSNAANCGMRGHFKKDCQNKKKITKKAPEATTCQVCVASTSGGGEILYSEAAINSKGDK